jgi:hypothetical protein
MLGYVRQVAGTNQQQAHAVHVIVIEDIIFHESIADDVCGQVQVVQGVMLSDQSQEEIFSFHTMGIDSCF